jgi:hypothetical protein
MGIKTFISEEEVNLYETLFCEEQTIEKLVEEINDLVLSKTEYLDIKILGNL